MKLTIYLKRIYLLFPLSDVNLPKVVYMIVDKKIELETKFLKDYPEWQFFIGRMI